MKRKNVLILATLLVILTSQIAVTHAADDLPILQVSVSDIYLTAGQENLITVNLKNTGDYKLFDIESTLTSTIPGISILRDVQKVYNEIEKGKTASYTPAVYIDQNVALGAYTLSLTVLYGRFRGTQENVKVIPVGIVVQQGYAPKIKYTTAEGGLRAKAGTVTALGLSFQNDWDSEIKELEFTFTSLSNYITITNNLSSSIQSLSVGEAVQLSPTVSVLEGTPLGVYTLAATVSYQDASDNKYHQTFTIPVNVDSTAASKNTVVTIKDITMPEHLKPGDVFDLKVNVQCTGADAYDIITKLSFGAVTALSPLSPTAASVGDLNVGKTVIVDYRVLVSGDVKAGQYPVSLSISYTNSKGTSDTLTETITVMVESLIDFEVLDAPTITVKKGEASEIEADLLLIGSDSVQFVSVELVESPVLMRVSGSTEYIGAVDPDSPIPFNIKYRVAADAPEGSHTMSVRVNYRDHLNREHHEDVGLGVTVVGAQSGGAETPEAPPLWMWVRRLLGLGP
jgi:hypothetical protein